jgi:cell division septation protein DedD
MTEAVVPKKFVRRRRRIQEAILVVPRSRLWWNTAASVLVLLGVFGMGFLLGRRSVGVKSKAVQTVPETQVSLALSSPKAPQGNAQTVETATKAVHVPREGPPTATASSAQASPISGSIGPVPGAGRASVLPSGFGVQLGAYPTRHEADATERRYRVRSSSKWPAYIFRYAAGDGQAWYRVRVGQFETHRQAKGAAKALIRTFPGAIVVRHNESGS